MKIVALGSSGGIAAAGDGNSTFFFEIDGLGVLVDCSGNPAASLAEAGSSVTELHTLILTHRHTDHIYALPSLIHSAWLSGRDKPLHIICNSATAAFAVDLLELFGLNSREGLFPIVWNVAEEGSAAIGSATLHWFPVAHSVPTIGLRIESDSRRIVYSADTAPCERLNEEARGATWLIHEASGGAAEAGTLNEKGHSTAKQAAELAGRVHAKQLWLLHVPPGRRAELAAEGQKYCAATVVVPDRGATTRLSSPGDSK